MIRQIVVLEQSHVDWLQRHRETEGIPMSVYVRKLLDKDMAKKPKKWSKADAKKHGFGSCP